MHSSALKNMSCLDTARLDECFAHTTIVATDLGGMKRQSRECTGQRNNSLRLAVANVLQVIQVAMRDLVPLLVYTPYT